MASSTPCLTGLSLTSLVISSILHLSGTCQGLRSPTGLVTLFSDCSEICLLPSGDEPGHSESRLMYNKQWFRDGEQSGGA